MERKPRRKKRGNANYPTHDRARNARRQFLKILGKSLLALPVAGLANACGIGREEHWQTSGDQAPPDWLEPDPDIIEDDLYSLGGIAAEDIDYQQPEVEEFELGGVAPPPDIQEEDFPPLSGDAPPPDLIEQPDLQEEDFPPLPGEAPFEPDIVAEEDVQHAADTKKEVDAEEWPLDSDMEIPEDY